MVPGRQLGGSLGFSSSYPWTGWLTCLQVLAWRADPSTAAKAKEVWSELASTNSVIVELLNHLAAMASVSRAHATQGASSFEAAMKVRKFPQNASGYIDTHH